MTTARNSLSLPAHSSLLCPIPYLASHSAAGSNMPLVYFLDQVCCQENQSFSLVFYFCLEDESCSSGESDKTWMDTSAKQEGWFEECRDLIKEALHGDSAWFSAAGDHKG